MARQLDGGSRSRQPTGVGVPRIATQDLEIGGWVVPAGTLVFLSTASANRDEAAYDEAATFDISSDRVPHLTFGGGPHYCLGANLARAEMEEALRILPGRLHDIRLDGQPSWRQGTGITGPSRLPRGRCVRVDAYVTTDVSTSPGDHPGWDPRRAGVDPRGSTT
jgi:cytochrome P450